MNLKMWKSIFFTILTVSMLPACNITNQTKDDSDLKITNGRQITDSQFAPVVRLEVGGTCTGTFVGDNALITAAHCVTNQAGERRPAWVGNFNGDRSIKTLIHPDYNQLVGGTDLAVLIFPPGTARQFAAVSKRIPQRGDDITIVGYGKVHHDLDSTVGTRRMGHNKLTERGADGTLTFNGVVGPDSIDNTSGIDSASSNGDSGGPMFIEGKIVGVTSGGYKSNDRKYSIYVDLQEASNLAFLKSALEEGARIPSLTEDNTPDNPLDDADHDLWLALGKPDTAAADSYSIHVSTASEITRVVLCSTEGPSLCLENSEGYMTTAREDAPLLDRLLFTGSDSLSVSSDKPLRAIAYKGDALISVRTIKFEAN